LKDLSTFVIRNCFFIFLQYSDYRLAQAMQFGQPLVFDCDYERYMRHQDCQNLVNQLLMTYGKNRDAKDPFHFVFTSLDPQGKLFGMLRKAQLTGEHCNSGGNFIV
jgi:hypothetical protein